MRAMPSVLLFNESAGRRMFAFFFLGPDLGPFSPTI